jgi:hypothetical protein
MQVVRAEIHHKCGRCHQPAVINLIFTPQLEKWEPKYKSYQLCREHGLMLEDDLKYYFECNKNSQLK